MKPSCLIVGAGMSGLTAAGELTAQGWHVTLLDKGRGVGGRMATRRIEESRFDHGAQFFTVREERFRSAVAAWESEGLVTPWFGEDGHIRYRAVDGMNSLAKHLAKDLDVRTETKVLHVEPTAKGWLAVMEAGEKFQADALVLTAPAPQSADLLEGCGEAAPSDIVGALRSIEFDPCFALMAILDGPSRVPAPGYVRISEGPVEWIADNTQKGVSTGRAALTIHARASFSRDHLEAPQEVVARLLLESAEPWLGSGVASWQLHRWRFSRPVDAARPACLFTAEPAPFAVAGDAFGNSRLETAFLSGLAAAEKISGR